MANVKISALPSITTLTDASVIPGVQSGETRKVLASEVQRYSLSGLPTYGGNVLANNVTANIYSVNTSISPDVTTGQIAWSSTERTFNMGMVNNTVLQVGQEEFIVVKAGEDLDHGQTVMFGGAAGNNLIGVRCNVATPGFKPDWFIGIATQPIAHNDFGYITVFGKVHGLDTSAWTAGTILYQSTSTAGALTDIEPDAPGPKITVAAVAKVSAGDGHLMVRPTPKPQLHDLSDVYANAATATSNQYFIHDTSGWYAANLDISHDTSPTLGGNLAGGNYTITTTGNISGGYILGNGSQLTGLPTTYTTLNVTNLVASNITANSELVTGNLTSGNLLVTGNITGNVNGYSIGYREIPQITFNANTTTALSDSAKHYYSTSSSNLTLTIANNATVSYNIGTALTVVNQGTGNITLTPDSGVNMYLAGNSTSSSRTLTTYGMATLMKVGTDSWFLNGVGLI